MRVLQINTERTWRGGERQTLYTLQGLLEVAGAGSAAGGIELGLLCLRDRPLHRALLAAPGDLPVAVHAVGSQRGAAAFLAGADARSYDLLHAQTARGQSLAVATRALHRRPLLYTRRVNFRPRGLPALLKYRLTDRTVAISSAIAATLAGIGVENAPVISSAVGLPVPDRGRAAAFAAEQRLAGLKVVATTGDLVPQKDPATLVETIGHLARLRDDFVFLHFGAQQMLPHVGPRLRDLGLADRFRLMGHVDRVEDYFPLFDVYLVTSDETEGLCSAIFDAYVHRVPVVSTLCGGMLDSVADRGLTCGPREPECLARQVARLLDEPDTARRLVDRAEAWALEHVTIPAIARRYLDLYREMLGA